MSFKCRLSVIATLVLAGCASAPERPAETTAVPASVPVEAEGGAGAAATAATAATGIVPAVDVATLADNNPVSCRDLLLPNSNVMRLQCMTRSDWKKWDQAQRLWAQDMLRRMQGRR